VICVRPSFSADLGGVAVDGLPPAEDDVVFDLLDGAAQDVARRQRVTGGAAGVGDQDGLVGAAIERVPQDLRRRRQAHRAGNAPRFTVPSSFMTCPVIFWVSGTCLASTTQL